MPTTKWLSSTVISLSSTSSFTSCCFPPLPILSSSVPASSSSSVPASSSSSVPASSSSSVPASSSSSVPASSSSSVPASSSSSVPASSSSSVPASSSSSVPASSSSSVPASSSSSVPATTHCRRLRHRRRYFSPPHSSDEDTDTCSTLRHFPRLRAVDFRLLIFRFSYKLNNCILAVLFSGFHTN